MTTFHLITSRDFWRGAPLIVAEIINRGHYFSVFDDDKIPSYAKLLDCDVLMDMSTITESSFYLKLRKELKKFDKRGLRVPLLVDSPEAILNSLNKTKTHDIFLDLVPKSYVLDGKNNLDIFKKFKDDKYLVIKDPLGWWGLGVRRLSPQEAVKKMSKERGKIAQRYIEPKNGIGRIITINYDNDFEIAASYSRLTKSWRTGTDVTYRCIKIPITKKLEHFARQVSKRCGLYFNGIDYIFDGKKYVLLEVNAVPAIAEPLEELGIDVAKKLLNHIEKHIS